MAVMRMFTARPRRGLTGGGDAATYAEQAGPPDGQAGAKSTPADSQVTAAGTPSTAGDVSARVPFAIGAPLVVFVGWIVLLVAHGFDQTKFPAALKVNGDVTSFALFYVAAQAIERALEPFSNLILKTEPLKKALDQAVAKALTTTAQADGEDAAKKQDDLDRKRGERALVLWAAATVLGMLASAGLGIYFVSAILVQGSSVDLRWDVAITGLVIGGGSKPLHDLITNIQQSKDKKADPPETAS